MQRNVQAEASPALRYVETEEYAIDNDVGKVDISEGDFADNEWDSEVESSSSWNSSGEMRRSAQLAFSLFTYTSHLLTLIRNPRVRMTFMQQDLRKRVPRHLRRVPREGHAKYESRTYVQSLDTIVEESEEE